MMSRTSVKVTGPERGPCDQRLVAPGVSELQRLPQLSVLSYLRLLQHVDAVVQGQASGQPPTDGVAPVERRILEFVEVTKKIEVRVQQQPGQPDRADDRGLETGFVEALLLRVFLKA